MYTTPLADMKGADTARQQPAAPSHCCVVTIFSTILHVCYNVKGIVGTKASHCCGVAAPFA